MKRSPSLVFLHYSMLVILALLCLAPIVVIFATSLRQQVQIFSEPLNFLFAPTLENYRAVLQEDKLEVYLGNSLFVGVISTLITLVIGCMAAYGLARFRFTGRTTLAYTTLLLRTVPLAVLAIPVFVIWNQWNLVNSLWGLILLYVAVNLPFTIWLLYGFVLQVPIELEEAAAIDGCSPLRIFTSVFLPLMAPGLAAASIFTFRIAWNEFIFALTFITREEMKTIPVAAAQLGGATQFEIPYGSIAAATIIGTLPLVVLVLFFQRKIIQGLTAGAVKG